MHLVTHLSMLGLCLAFTRLAQAGAPATPLEPARAAPAALPPVEYDDYRLTLLAVDAASVSLLVLGGLASENEGVATAFVVSGLAGYALGAPIVHFERNQTGRAVGSFALRVGLPAPGILIAATGAASCEADSADTSDTDEYEDDSGWCAVAAVGFGGLLAVGGALAAMIVDDTVLGKAPKPWPPEEKTRGESTFRLGVVPLVEPRRKTAGLSLVGAF
jgi:hypothetical protein